MNSDHAPTADEQLPPEVAALLENSRFDSYMIVGSEVRMVIMHLTAALRENREMKGWEADALEYRAKYKSLSEYHTKTMADKDARIAELEKRCNTFMQGLEAEEKDCEALHAKLRAVSDALETYYEGNQLWGRLARIRAILEGK